MEEKRTSRQHGAMDVLMDEGQTVDVKGGIVAGTDLGNLVDDVVIGFIIFNSLSHQS